MTTAARIEPVGDVQARLGECPTWDDRDGCLWWVDIPGRSVLRTDVADGATQTFPCPEMPGSIGLADDGTVVVALAGEIGSLDIRTGRHETVAAVPHDSRMMMNDGSVDAAGRFLAGSMSRTGAVGESRLYSLEHGRLRTLLTGVTTSNGLDWSPDGRTLYYIDSATYRLEAFDYEVTTGNLENRRSVYGFDPDRGLPDGLAVDAEGGIWVTLWGSAGHQSGGGRLVRVEPSGRFDAEIALPTEGSTSCAFGGSDLATLFVTTSYEFLDAAQRAGQPLAGRLLAVEPGVRGARPANRYASGRETARSAADPSLILW